MKRFISMIYRNQYKQKVDNKYLLYKLQNKNESKLKSILT